MHLPDNYLSPATCTIITAASVPVIAISVNKIKVQLKKNMELIPRISIASSLSFLIMMFNIPAPGGTTVHAVGATLLAILLGPYAACLAVSVALLLQAFLFGDGGILSLGVNIFNMACVMPFLGYAIYKFFEGKGFNNLGVILGSYFGINITAFLVGIELGIQPIIAHSSNGNPLYNPYPLHITLPAMMLSHIFIGGVVEAFFSYIVFKFISFVAPEEIYKTEERISIYTNKGKKSYYYLILLLIIISPIGLLAKGTAFGEWSNEELLEQLKSSQLLRILPEGMKNGISYHSLFSEYKIYGIPISLGYVLSAITAIIIFLLIGKVLLGVYEKSNNKT